MFFKAASNSGNSNSNLVFSIFAEETLMLNSSALAISPKASFSAKLGAGNGIKGLPKTLFSFLEKSYLLSVCGAMAL